jgi:hypothetical protein
MYYVFIIILTNLFSISRDYLFLFSLDIYTFLKNIRLMYKLQIILKILLLHLIILLYNIKYL